MKRSFVLLLVVTAAFASLAGAQPTARPHGGAVLAQYLQLTPDQVASWKQIHSETASAIQPLAQNARDLQKQLNAALTAATPDAASVGKLALSLHAVRTQIRTVRQESQTKLRAVLTADQAAKYDAFLAAAEFQKRQGRGH